MRNCLALIEMNRWPQAHWLLMICVASPLAIARPAAGAGTNNAVAPLEIRPVLNPPLPPGYSPVDFFRQLLAMSPEERDSTWRTVRRKSANAFSPRFTNIWRSTRTSGNCGCARRNCAGICCRCCAIRPRIRDAQLAQVPEDLRDLVKSRLLQWEILPPPLQQEFLDNERALSYFARRE